MMSLEVIESIAVKAGARAAREGKRPFVFFRHDEATILRTSKGVPFLGSLEPKGWRPVERVGSVAFPLFVDSCGFGADDEPALTQAQYLRKLEESLRSAHDEDAKATYGFAVVQAGQFQVYVGAFIQDASFEGNQEEYEAKAEELDADEL